MLQLLGVSSMLLVASKYEEITPPHVEELYYITDKQAPRKRVCKWLVLGVRKDAIGNSLICARGYSCPS